MSEAKTEGETRTELYVSTPWEAYEIETVGNKDVGLMTRYGIVGGPENNYTVCQFMDFPTSIGKHLAETVAQAVNSHEAMRDALKSAAEIMSALSLPREDGLSWFDRATTDIHPDRINRACGAIDAALGD